MEIANPSDSAGHTLWKLAHAMQQRMTDKLAALDLSLSQLGTLIYVARGEAVSTADLARTVLMTPQNMGLTVRRLEAKGYLARRPHAYHGRINHLEVTESGRHVMLKAIGILEGVEGEMLSGMAPDDRGNFISQLHLALKNLCACED